MKARQSIHIGTSGWHYAHWRGPFYPRELRSDKFLQYYFNYFHTVEINNSFYRLPLEKTLVQWKEVSPAGFLFAVKASRFISHLKKLKDPEKSLPPFLSRMEILRNKLGPILFQLPPHWKLNLERLRLFMESLPTYFRYSFEFRDPTWFTDSTYHTLAEKGIAFCIFDLNGRLSPKVLTADFVYIRLHGPEGPYQGQYSLPTLSGWVEDFHLWTQQGKEIFCYFDNDEAGYAAQDALKLQRMVNQRIS